MYSPNSSVNRVTDCVSCGIYHLKSSKIKTGKVSVLTGNSVLWTQDRDRSGTIYLFGESRSHRSRCLTPVSLSHEKRQRKSKSHDCYDTLRNQNWWTLGDTGRPRRSLPDYLVLRRIPTVKDHLRLHAPRDRFRLTPRAPPKYCFPFLHQTPVVVVDDSGLFVL